MLFELMEVKVLGKGQDRILSLRLEKSASQCRVEEDSDYQSGCESGGIPTPDSRFSVHAVVPFNYEFSRLQVGQTFLLTRIARPIFMGDGPLGTVYTNDQGETTKFEIQKIVKATRAPEPMVVLGRVDCNDSACKLMDSVPHEFGPGCRLWGTKSPEAMKKGNPNASKS